MSKVLVTDADDYSGSEDPEEEFHSKLEKVSDWDLQESAVSCCTAACCCHICYVVLFLVYIVVFPLWGKWLFTAPMPKNFWHDDLPNFPLLPSQQWDFAQNANPRGPEIIMTGVPLEVQGCNYSCGSQLDGLERGSQMNFNVDLTLDSVELAEVYAHTVYPVLLASDDFEHWNLVADRRNAAPEPFWSARSEDGSSTYIANSGHCSGGPEENFTFSSEATYFIGCVTWTTAGRKFVQGAKKLTKLDIRRHCTTVGGVCGWPCGSNVPPDRLMGCDNNGIVDVSRITGQQSSDDDQVIIKGCLKAYGECFPVNTPMSEWHCHRCHVEKEAEDDEEEDDMDDDDDDEDGGAGSDFDEDMAWRRRRLQDDEADDVSVVLRYRSLPRMQMMLIKKQLPKGVGIMSAPHAFILASHSLHGPWTRLYKREHPKSEFPPPEPMGVETDRHDPQVVQDEDTVYAMKLMRKNTLTIRPDSCFGQRGPLYLVACAVNSSIYDDGSQWRDLEGSPQFEIGQVVRPPPFNDRCLAVSGRCAMACMAEQQPLRHCRADGYIDYHALMNHVPLEYNRTPAVLAFIIVLLCGFAVKTLMLCPGIFSPYTHAYPYEPEMTEAFRYIIVVSPVAGADENKGTMLRNLVGVISCMPPDCRCRYHAVINDEGHRDEMKICWELICQVIEAIPSAAPDPHRRTYEQLVLEYTHIWCGETKILGLIDVGGKVKALDPKVLDRLCGRTTLKKLMKEYKHWCAFDRAIIAPLERAVEALCHDLATDYNKFHLAIAHLDVIGDWAPRSPDSMMLRLHYTSRAKPMEDDRNIMVQHVAVGSWYYKVPRGATTDEWLKLRRNCKEMVYAIPDPEPGTYNVPLRSSHGKAGGLNFVDNYMAVLSRKPENICGDSRAESPTLYAIADARHQFQPDFMISCIPCFFTEDGILNPKVAFTQAPQHYPEYHDKSDYMDYNNAQFFRLNAMIRNCCGGVSSCGTNGMWLVPNREDETIWQARRKRVRDASNLVHEELIEREQFHTSCKIEDTASSLDQVLVGRHSHFVNRKLSFGMAKAPSDFIGAQQRWVEGAVTLCLQWFSFNADAHGDAANNVWMLWATVAAFISFIIALSRLVINHSEDSLLVSTGAISEEAYSFWSAPARAQIRYWMVNSEEAFKLFGGNELDLDVFESMVMQFVDWACTFILLFLALWCVTMSCSCFKKLCYFPNEMRWWGRLIISMDNLTYFFWFWTSFFWIGFNYYTALFRMSYHFNNKGMMTFMLVVNSLNWSMIIANTFRYNVMESMDANEIAALSMDNIWRSNQLFFMTGPIQLFSLVRGFSEFTKYKFYGQDIGGWSGGDLGRISVNIVKYWTTMMLLGCCLNWACYVLWTHEYQNAFSACIVVTLISLDVLHPCTFLWVGNVHMTPEERRQLSWSQALTDRKWWQWTIKNLILNQTFTGVLKYLAPSYFILLPVMALFSSYVGMNGAYMLVAMGPGH